MFIVIEKFDVEFPTIVSDMESGMPMLFDTAEEAQIEADECQDGIVLELIDYKDLVGKYKDLVK